MVNVNIGHNPGLTHEQAMEIFKKHLQFEVTTKKVWGDYFLVIKDNLVSAAIKIKQKENKTIIEVRGYIHEFYMRLLLILFCFLPYYIVWLGPAASFAKEIASFIETCPDFKTQ
ncbi:MAG: hypothetical protein ACTSO7_05445 [Candidatus Heimdallarchaeota archaeon]